MSNIKLMHTDTHSVYINHIPSIQKMRKKFLTTRLINDVDIINPKAHIFFGGRVLSFLLSHTLDQRAGIEALKIKMHCQVCLKTSNPFYVSRGLGLIYIHAI